MEADLDATAPVPPPADAGMPGEGGPAGDADAPIEGIAQGVMALAQMGENLPPEMKQEFAQALTPLAQFVERMLDQGGGAPAPTGPPMGPGPGEETVAPEGPMV